MRATLVINLGVGRTREWKKQGRSLPRWKFVCTIVNPYAGARHHYSMCLDESEAALDVPDWLPKDGGEAGIVAV